MKDSVKGIFSFVMRIVLSVGLLWWLFTMVQWPETLNALRQANLFLLLIAFCIHIIIQGLGLWRWHMFMKALEFSAPLSQVCRYFFIGLFGNLFLPTAIGGDLIKAYGLARGMGQRPKVYASVVLDRLSGFLGLAIIACMAYALGQHLIHTPYVIGPIIFLTLLSVFLGMMFFYPPFYDFIAKVFQRIPKLQQTWTALHQDMRLLKKSPHTAMVSIGISMGVQILNAFLCYLIALALHQEVSFLPFLVFAPIVGAISFLPSLGGLGVRELGWVYFLSQMGMAEGVALSLSLIGFFFVVLIGLWGGVMYATTPSYRRLQSDT